MNEDLSKCGINLVNSFNELINLLNDSKENDLYHMVYSQKLEKIIDYLRDDIVALTHNYMNGIPSINELNEVL